ncbi:hypothetical protein AX774_g432 [Zancudomyces culisetae]|uniref:Uncharacterized protein n=1 Tax=Zancudomyces culisetae TaxID=1213189 RepID=A0A1R1PYI7_ZANCU|nr:hypothetical protein AX774_g432 [Zancudomyces culisetae]|eukprot:OMH86013.1 hypothetical protein AX774_g432 [Zancudomyces culisetae]
MEPYIVNIFFFLYLDPYKYIERYIIWNTFQYNSLQIRRNGQHFSVVESRKRDEIPLVSYFKLLTVPSLFKDNLKFIPYTYF